MAGCATQPYVTAHIESVNAEYRQLEDYVYCLEDENARLEQRMAELQANYARVRAGQPPREGILQRRQTGGGTDLAPPEIEIGPTDPPEIEIPDVPRRTPPARTPPAGGIRSRLQRPLEAPSIDSPDLGPPSIEIPDLPQTPTPPATESLPIPTTPTRPQPGVPELLPVKPSDPKVTHIHLNPLMTGGADFDGQPGDEGLSVLIEPRNAADEFVPQAGAVSVVVLDPAKEGDAARVARWDFTLSAAQQKLATASAASGIQLEMPWPASPPANNKLKLFVRYEGPDGRQLVTDRDIYITPPGQITRSWTPRPAERARPASAVAAAAKVVEDSETVATAEARTSATESNDEKPPRPAVPPPQLSDDTDIASQPAAWSPFR